MRRVEVICLECFRVSASSVPLVVHADAPAGYSFGRCRCGGVLYSVPVGCAVVLEEGDAGKMEKFRRGCRG